MDLMKKTTRLKKLIHRRDKVLVVLHPPHARTMAQAVFPPTPN